MGSFSATKTHSDRSNQVVGSVKSFVLSAFVIINAIFLMILLLIRLYLIIIVHFLLQKLMKKNFNEFEVYRVINKLKSKSGGVNQYMLNMLFRLGQDI